MMVQYFFVKWLFSVRFCLADKNPQQHVPLQEYSENLKEITRLLASAGVPADRVIFITPPPIHEQTWEKECILKGFIPCIYFLSCFRLHTNHSVFQASQSWFMLSSSPGSPLNRLNSVAGQYAQACVQAAGHCGSDVLDLWTLMQKDGHVGGADTITSNHCGIVMHHRKCHFFLWLRELAPNTKSITPALIKLLRLTTGLT